MRLAAGGRAWVRVGGGLARDIYLAQTRHAPWRGSDTPRSVARQSPTTSAIAFSVVATSDLCRATMHDVAQAFGRARAIGAAKSVSFKKKTDRVRFKISFQKVLKLKKNSRDTGRAASSFNSRAGPGPRGMQGSPAFLSSE